MTEKEPTQEQIREFWEWCGFRFKLSASENPHYWIDSYGRALSKLPKADLNNLFKYAVPKLTTDKTIGYFVGLSYNGGEDYWKGLVTNMDIAKDWEAQNDDAALALFWAIWEVIK